MLQNMQLKFVEEKKELWDSYLDTYNTSWHQSTHFTPFKLSFGRKAVPIDIEMSKKTAKDALALYSDDSDVLADNAHVPMALMFLTDSINKYMPFCMNNLAFLACRTVS